MNETPTLNPRHLRRRLDAAASQFDTADFVHTVTRDGLHARLKPLLLTAESVLDLGSATGAAHNGLKTRFPRAHHVAFDISRNMLAEDRRKRSWRARLPFSRSTFVQGDASKLPFKTNSFDVVFSNLLLPYIDQPDSVFAEVARILREDGVFAFATLGPDSLRELRDAWQSVDGHQHVNRFPDMHDIGDALMRGGLREPVLDVDRLTVRYDDVGRLFSDLTSVGGRNALLARNPGAVGRRRFGRMLEALRGPQKDGAIALELELIFGHCFGGSTIAGPGAYRIDASEISIRRG